LRLLDPSVLNHPLCHLSAPVLQAVVDQAAGLVQEAVAQVAVDQVVEDQADLVAVGQAGLLVDRVGPLVAVDAESTALSGTSSSASVASDIVASAASVLDTGPAALE